MPTVEVVVAEITVAVPKTVAPFAGEDMVTAGGANILKLTDTLSGLLEELGP